MLIKSVIKRLVAFFLVFTLTFANFALVTTSYASNLITSVFSGSSNTGGDNVIFDAYFEDDIKSYSGNSALNAESVNLKLDLAVEESGYLKNAQIAIKESNENMGLNFKIASELDDVNYEFLKSFENNVLTLKQIPSNSQIDLQLPLVYENEDFIRLDKLNKTFDVVLMGIYVNDKGKELQVNKKVTLKLAWKDNREIKISSEVTKFVSIESGAILQTLVRVDSEAKASGAVKSTNLQIEVPRIKGATVENVEVTAKSTKGTNGKSANNVEFTENNWKYKDGIISINVENKPEKDDLYYSKSGADEYLITYIIKNLSSMQIAACSNVKAIVTTFGEKDIKNIAEEKFDYVISDKKADLVTYEMQSDIKNISKSYMYYNYLKENDNLDEIEFNYNEGLNISNYNSVEEIDIEDSTNNYKDTSENLIELKDVYYKKIPIPKEIFNKILGEDGNIQILKLNGAEIGKIDKESKIEDDNYVYYFKSSIIDKVKVKINNPISNGNLILDIVKSQTKSNYEKEVYKSFDSMIFSSSLKTKYKNNQNLVEDEVKNIEFKLDDTQTKPELVLSNDNISIYDKTDIEMKIKLNNENIQSDIYGNSIFEIKLPKYIEDVEIKDYNIAYSKGLVLKNVEKVLGDQVIIRATLEGIQNSLSPGKITGGTNIIINATLKLKKEPIPKIEDEVIFTYTNNEATNYFNNGIQTQKITYLSPTGVISINSLKNYKDSENLISINEGTKKATIATYSNSINPTMEIIVMNNNTNKISNISILGRVPVTGTKDIINNELLKTTIDANISSKIISDENNGANFKIYYSPNGEATTDLNNPLNEWNENLDLNLVKSFLIVPEDENYELDVSKILKFSYEFNIPDNLEYNNDCYGTFATYYKTNEDDQSEVSIPDKIYLTTGIKQELELETRIDSGQTIAESEEFTITSKVTNKGEEDIEEVLLKIPIPNQTTKSYSIVSNDDILVSNEGNNEIYKIPKIEKGNSIEVSLKVKVNSLVSEEISNITSSITAKNLPKEINSENIEIKLVKSKLKIDIENPLEKNQISMKEDTVTSFKVIVQNITEDDISNIKVKLHIDDKFKIMNLFVADPQTEEIEEFTTVKREDGDVVINFDKIGGMKQKYIAVNIKAKDLLEDSLLEKSYIYAKAEGENVEEINSSSIEYSIGKPKVTFYQTTNTPTYINSTEEVEYDFIIKNEGTYSTGTFKFECLIPENLFVKKINIKSGSNERNEITSELGTITRNLEVNASDQLEIKILCEIGSNPNDEYTITNKAILTSDIFGKIESNEVKHKVKDWNAILRESSEEKLKEIEKQNDKLNNDETLKGNENEESEENIKTTELTGYVWLDNNSNGARDKNEKTLASTKVKLLEANTGQIVDTVTTDSNGKYTFNVKNNGYYLVFFEYDSERYILSAYQKEGIAQSNNSDVISTKIQDGDKTEQRSNYRSNYFI